MSDSFGMEVLKTLQNGDECIDDFLFFKVELVTGMNAIGDFSFERSHAFFVEDTGGKEVSLKEMIMEKVPLLKG